MRRLNDPKEGLCMLRWTNRKWPIAALSATLSILPTICGFATAAPVTPVTQTATAAAAKLPPGFVPPSTAQYKAEYSRYLKALKAQKTGNFGSTPAPLANGIGNQDTVLYQTALAVFNADMSTYNAEEKLDEALQTVYDGEYMLAMQAIDKQALAWDVAHECAPGVACEFPTAAQYAEREKFTEAVCDRIGGAACAWQYYQGPIAEGWFGQPGQDPLWAAIGTGFTAVIPKQQNVTDWPKPPNFVDIYARYLAYYSAWMDKTFASEPNKKPKVQKPPKLSLEAGCPDGEVKGASSRGGVKCVKKRTLSKAQLIKYNPTYQSTAKKPVAIDIPDLTDQAPNVTPTSPSGATLNTPTPVSTPTPATSPLPAPPVIASPPPSTHGITPPHLAS